MEKQKHIVYAIKKGRWFFRSFGILTGNNYGSLKDAQFFLSQREARKHLDEGDIIVMIQLREV